MTIKLYSKFHTPIALKDKTADRNDQRLLARANSCVAVEEGNEFLFQELHGEGFIVRTNSIWIKQPTSFVITAPFSICFQISMFQTTQYELAGYGPLVLHQRRYNIMAVPSFSAQFKISKHSLLLPLEIHCTKDFLEPLRKTYQNLNDFLKKVETGKPAVLFDVNPIASTEMLSMIDLIIECGRDSSWDFHWLNIYVHELLHLSLTPKHKIKKVKFTQDEINRIYEAEELLLQTEKKVNADAAKLALAPKTSDSLEEDDNPSGNGTPWGIKDFAECADMSVYLFNKIFKELFGQSVINYRKEIIWQSVIVALLRGHHNLKTITSAAEYNDQPSFSRAFKKRFGHTPSEFVQLFLKKYENYTKNAKGNPSENLPTGAD